MWSELDCCLWVSLCGHFQRGLTEGEGFSLKVGNIMHQSGLIWRDLRIKYCCRLDIFFLPHCLLSLPLLLLVVAAIPSTAATLWTSELSFFSISMSLSRPFSELSRPLASSWECQTFSLIDRPPTSLLAYQRYAKLLSNYSASRGSNDLVNNVL